VSLPTFDQSETQSPGFEEELPGAEESLPSCFARIARTYPNNIALLSDNWRPTYSELDDLTNRLARALSELGGSRGDRVAILMRHDAPMVASILAILKAGRVVVVLNDTQPADRLRQLLHDATPSALIADITRHELAVQVKPLGCQILRYEDSIVGEAAEPLLDDIDPADTAFLVYTSGSTGIPKAVMQSHRMIRRCAIAYFDTMGFVPTDRIALFGSPSGAQGVLTIWCAISYGATLCPFPVIERGLVGLASWIIDREITVYISSASTFRNFMSTLKVGLVFESVRVIRLASEPATVRDFELYQQHFSTACRFVHSLASSEAGVIACISLSPMETVAVERLPVGRIQRGIEVLLVGDDGREVPAGDAGEIVLRGRYLANGYWRDPLLTARRFQNQHESDLSRRFFTGDIGRFDGNNFLVVLGRRDGQVKVRGNRIEPAEIANVLLRIPNVEQVAIVAKQELDDVRLVAYVVLRRGQHCSAQILRDSARVALPSYMVPSTFIFLEQFPLTSHGKIDYEKLRCEPFEAQRFSYPEPPTTKTEEILVHLWREVFAQADVSRNDDFFDLGGDSLTAAVIAAKVHASLEVELNLGHFVRHPKLADLAALVQELVNLQETNESKPILRVPRSSSSPVSLFQERIWRFSQAPELSAGYTIAKRYRIQGELDVAILRDCITYISGRHDLLRSTFGDVSGVPVQHIHSLAPIPIPLIDFSEMSDAASRADAFFRKEASRIFDVSILPLACFSLVRVRRNDYWLVSISHHILADGQSWNIFFDELAMLYEARIKRQDPPLLPAEPLQYSDYAVWHRDRMQITNAEYRSTLDWWTTQVTGIPCDFELPFKRTEPALQATAADGFVKWTIQPEIFDNLKEVARKNNATYFMLLLAAFSALLAASTGRSDFLVGAYVTKRNRVALRNMFGFFANLTALRFKYDPKLSFRGWLSHVRDLVIEAETFGDLPFEELRLRLQENGVVLPETKAMLNVGTFFEPKYFCGLEVNEAERSQQNMPWGFSLNCDPRNEMGNEAAFDARIYDVVGMREFVDNYIGLLRAISQYPETSLDMMMASVVDPKGCNKVV
jgi:amino acid adenylation domain-containing protein